jgi:hypothetical protein
MPTRAVLELQAYVTVDWALAAVVDAILDVAAPVAARRDPSDLALRAALEPRNLPFREVGARESATLRVTTRHEEQVEYNHYTEEERVRTTCAFEVSTSDGALRVANVSDSTTAALTVAAPDALFEDLRAALRSRVASWLTPPRIAAHPSAPGEWLSRAAAFGLASHGMEIDRTVGAALWHADGDGWFGMLYASSPSVLYALGPRPPLGAPALDHQSAPSSAPRLDDLRDRISEALGVLGSEALEQSGVSARVLHEPANPSFSLAYFDLESFYGDFSWTRSRTRDGWLLRAERSAPAEPHPMVELAWIDRRCRYFAHLKYQHFGGHRLEARFVGAHAEALRASMARPDRA